MPRSDMRHPYFETAILRARREAREEIRRFLDDAAAKRAGMAGRRILPALTATPTLQAEARQ